MLPFSYNENCAYLFALSPDRLFGYWDYDTETWQKITSAPARPVVLLLCSGEQIVRRIEIHPETKNYYFTGVIPATAYRLCIATPENGEDVALIETPVATTPRDRPSPQEDTVFARQSEERGLDSQPMEAAISNAPSSELFVQLFGTEQPSQESQPLSENQSSEWPPWPVERPEGWEGSYQVVGYGSSSENHLKQHTFSGAGRRFDGGDNA